MKPGSVVLEKNHNGDRVVIRYVDKHDVEVLHKYINQLSKEQTFISYQGEEISMEEEQKHVEDVVKKISDGVQVKLLLLINGEVCGVSEVGLLRRSAMSHVGGLGLSLSSHVRGRGLGRLMIETTIKEAVDKLNGLRMIELTVFATNDIARNLYKSCGFVDGGIIPERILHRGKYVDEYFMYKKL